MRQFVEQCPQSLRLQAGFNAQVINIMLLSVLWYYLLNVKKSIPTVKTEWWGADMVICLPWSTNNLYTGRSDATVIPPSLASLKTRMVCLAWGDLHVDDVSRLKKIGFYMTFESWPSVLWHCWLSVRKSIRSLKKFEWCCHDYLSGTRCKRFAYGPADATATPSSLASLNPEWFCLSGVGSS